MSDMNPSRRGFLSKLGIGMLGLSLPFSAFASAPFAQKGRTLRLYVGTYSKGRKEGIYIYDLNADTGELQQTGAVAAQDPSYLTMHPQKKYLYAVNEVGDFQGKSSGAVSAFAVDPKSGNLTLLNQQASHGGSPCYITTDKGGKYALVANYMGGNVALLPIKADGQLNPASDVKQHKGTGPDTSRQEAAHAHCIIHSPDNRFAFAVDLGADKIFIYKPDVQEGKLIPHEPAFVATKAGAGPRHLVFHPTGRFAYVINELDSTMNVYAYDQQMGTLKELQSVSMLPQGYTGKNQCADVRVSQDGRFLYGSNRGHNSIAVFAIEKSTGKLSLVEHVSTQGDWPRNFALVPGGKLLLVANERTDNIVAFNIHPKTGKLTPTGKTTKVGAPVCLLIV